MRTFHLKFAGREQGPFDENQASQLFADGVVNRDTPCKVAGASDWKTIDDFMPMLKYGTQLPNPTSPVVRTEDPPPYGYGAVPPALPRGNSAGGIRVSVVDFDLTRS